MFSKKEGSLEGMEIFESPSAASGVSWISPPS